jgi:hypothetical protein
LTAVNHADVLSHAAAWLDGNLNVDLLTVSVHWLSFDCRPLLSAQRPDVPDEAIPRAENVVLALRR